MLTRTSANRRLVVAVSDEAEKFGIKPGMTLPEARSLCAYVQAIEHQPHRDAVALEAIARWMLRFTPIVTVGDGSDTLTGVLPPHPSSLPHGERGPEPRARINRFCQGERLIFEGVAAHPRDQLRVRAMADASQSVAHSALLLDLTGSQYVFNGYANIVRQIEDAMRRFGLRASIATGPTVGAAWALTFAPVNQPKSKRVATEVPSPVYSRERVKVRAGPLSLGGEGWGEGEPFERRSAKLRASASGELPPHPNPLPLGRGNIDCQPWQTALNDIPPHALRIDDDTIAALHHLGINTIGLLRKLPRRELMSRFGPLLLKRLNQAMGLDDEVLVPIRPIEQIESAVEFEFGVDSLELLWATIQQHIDQIASQLTRRGLGVRSMEFSLLLQDEAPLVQTLNLSRPSRDPKRLFRLIRVATESFTNPTFTETRRRATSRRLFGARFCGLRLRVIDALRLRDDQIALLESENVAIDEAITDLVERLTLRLTNGCVGQAQLVESHLPERTWKLEEPFTTMTATACRVGIAHQSARVMVGNAHPTNSASDHLEFNPNLIDVPPRPHRDESPTNPRPIHVTPPQEIDVMVSPSHDRDGKPVAYTTPDGTHRRILHARGPERIAGEWWRGHVKTRDYFDIEDEAHQRLWVFRVNDNGRWFAQGTF